MGIWRGWEELHRCHFVLLLYCVLRRREEGGEEEGREDILSSMYQLQGSSTRVFSVCGRGEGNGFIHVVAETPGEKLIGWMGGVEGRK